MDDATGSPHLQELWVVHVEVLIAVGFVDDVSCQSRLRSGVMETLGSSSLAVDIVDAMSSFVGVRILPSAPP